MNHSLPLLFSHKRPFVISVLLLLFLGACRSAPEIPVVERPNIVIVMADDLGYSDIGAYGGEIQTPHLDRLAQNGLAFSQFYNAARCCPTRASLLTGLYPHQAGMGMMVTSVSSIPVQGPYQGYLNDQSVTIAEVLGQAGYRTYISGKWHVGEKKEHWPLERGFDRYFGLISGASSYYEVITDQPRVRQMALDSIPWTPPETGFYMTDAISDYAVDFIQTHEQETPDQPFFLYVPYTAPHWPLHALPEDIARYEGVYAMGWDSLRTLRYQRMIEEGIIDAEWPLSPRPEPIPAWESIDDKAPWIERMQVYAAMVDRMDQGIGKIIETLEATGKLDNTIIFFLSDNGASPEDPTSRGLHDESVPQGAKGSYDGYRTPWANASNTPFRYYKAWAHEGGIATPLIVHWPAGIQDPGRRPDQLGHVVDLMATSIDLAGATYPERTSTGQTALPLEGQSLLPVMQPNTQGYAEKILYWEHGGAKALRAGKWKISAPIQSDEWELYDIEADRTELNDLSESHPAVRDSLKLLWERWAARVGVEGAGVEMW